MIKIPFNRPVFAGNELKYIKEAVLSGKISGDGLFSKKCTEFIEKKFNTLKTFLVPSGTAALDMTALLTEIKPGDEVILPSFTFTSTANAFVLFGAKPKFVDIRSDTFNIDESKIAENINRRTKAICCVHYAGIACEMNRLKEITKKHGLLLIEDAAQGINAKYKDKYLGTIGDLGIYSFHETKNANCGEGGALLINNSKFIKRAEIIREKGTNRSQFFRGEVDKYTWHDIGSSYLLSEILAAYLYAQLEHIGSITEKRKKIYNYYKESFKGLEKHGVIKLPAVPEYCQPNFHIFYLLFNSQKERDRIMDGLKKAGILAVFHYLPLHTSPMGKKFGYKKGDLPVTENIAGRLLRLPVYNDISIKELDYIQKTVRRLI
jgi:dTDP-4-amino-4,6-dideoxygalactose transaminase